MSKRIIISIVACSFLAVIPLWIWIVAPQLTKLPNNFSYKADVVSLDNFYNEAKQQFSGEARSVTKFSYEVTGEKDGILTVKNIFDVRKVTGEKIFSVERLYGIDPKTGKHVAGYGDRDRDGYLFAPKDLQKGEPFTYWHINYDGPAHMTFVREENLLGLSVYRYETDFKGVRIDQTKNLTNLPSVGVTRGIELEPHLELWVEPTTGRLIKYKDDTIAYYYDLMTGKRLNPWNHFTNNYTSESVIEQVGIARQEKLRLTLIEYIVPTLFALFAAIFILFQYRKNKTVKFLSIGIFAAAIIVGIGMWLVPKIVPSSYTGPVEIIKVGSYTGEYASLVYVALEKGYFTEEGIDLELKPYQGGIFAMPDLATGVIDIVLANEFAPVVKSFDTPDLKILASIDQTNSYEFIARRDRGIDSPENLKGKKIGITKKTQSEFFLGTFLTSNDLLLKDVTIIDIKPLDIPAAIESGTIDATLIWPPHTYNIKKNLGANAISWPGQSEQGTYFVLVGTDTLVKERPQTVERVLRALVKAEEFVKNNPQEAQAIVMRRTNVDDLYIKSEWPLNKFSVSLDQSLLLLMENEARWSIANKITDKTIVPNFIDFIYTDALRKVKLDAVTLY